MKPVAEHLRDALALVAPLPPVEVGLTEALGCVLAADVRSLVSLPPFDNSSMDGYAVVVADVASAGETPVVLPVVDDLPAGASPTVALVAGTAIRIMTGAPVPEGTEAVVPVEWTDAGVETVTVSQAPEPAQNIRRSGEDVVAGDLLVGAGTRLSPRHVGLLAATGHATVPVHPRPRVVLMSSGSEIIAPGGVLGPGQIFDSNSWALAAAVTEVGGIAVRAEGVEDEPAAVVAALQRLLADADVVVTTGGVSAGAYDTVKEVLSTLGTVRFEKIGMQPGMPQGLGTISAPALAGRSTGRPDDRAVPIFTLPGNPVSSYVSFEMFVRPALRKMLGETDVHRPTVTARSASAWGSPAGRVQVARVRMADDGSGPVAHLVGGHGSHLVADLSTADALALVPADVTRVEVGDELQCLLLDGA